MQSASSVMLLNFLYVTLKSKIFPIIHIEIHIVQEFGDITVYIFSILVIVMLIKIDRDVVNLL